MVQITHLPITKSFLIATISQIIAVVVAFGVINNAEAGIFITAATAVVNAAFLVANAIHAFAQAHAKVGQIR